MRRPLYAVLGSFVLVTNLLEAQETKSQFSEPGVTPASGDGTIVINLLQQSHEVSQQLPVPVRLNLLARQAQMVSQLRPDLAREWAAELFALSSQTKGQRVSSDLNTSIDMLIRLEPNRALELLHNVNIQKPVPRWATTPPEMGLVHRLFELLVQRDGVSALPVLQQEAERLGIQGHYPYGALGYATMQATSEDWGSDSQNAIRVLQRVFEPAFARYAQHAHTYYDDFEFANMLQVFAGGLPLESVQPALHLLVKNLLATNTRTYQFEADVYTRDGKILKMHNTIDATILYFGMLINRDPGMVQQLGVTRPELQTALESTKAGQRGSSNLHSPRSFLRLRPEQETRMDAVRLSTENPEAAIAKAQQLPEDQRGSTMLDIARNLSGDYPERAAELIAEIQPGDKPVDDETSVNLISAQAFVAAAQNEKDQLRELLQRGFELASRVILEQQRTGDIHFFTGLGPLVQVGVDNDPDLTIPFIESLSSSRLKVDLLLAAASDLSMGTRVPLRFHPQQKVEKPAQ